MAHTFLYAQLRCCDLLFLSASGAFILSALLVFFLYEQRRLETLGRLNAIIFATHTMLHNFIILATEYMGE